MGDCNCKSPPFLAFFSVHRHQSNSTRIIQILKKNFLQTFLAHLADELWSSFGTRFHLQIKNTTILRKKQAELTHANPAYAKVRYSNGREATVSPEALIPGQRKVVDEIRLNEGANRSPIQAEVLFCQN